MFELWQWLSYAIGIGGGYDNTSSAISQKPQASSLRWLFIPDGPTWNLDLKHVDKMLTDGAYLRIWLHFLCNSSSLKLVRFMPEAGASWKLDLKKEKECKIRREMKRQQLRANSSGPENFISVQAIAHQLLRTVLQAYYIHTLFQPYLKTLLSICLSVGHLLSLTSRDWEGNTKKYLECLTKLSWGTSCTIVICNLTWNVSKEMWWCKDPQNIEQKYTTEI